MVLKSSLDILLLASCEDNFTVGVDTVHQELQKELNMVTQTRVHLQTLVGLLLIFVGKYSLTVQRVQISCLIVNVADVASDFRLHRAE